MHTVSGSYTINEQQNQAFAALSGDFNPLHVDPVYSRRLQFGKPVIHGVHTLLRVWDEVLSRQADIYQGTIAGLTATFPNPVSIGQPVDYECRGMNDAGEVLLSARSAGKTILSLKLRIETLHPDISHCAIHNALPPQEIPIDQGFPPQHSSGSCDLYLDARRATALFPSLAPHLSPLRLAQITASTRVVGMRCPGLHSIFSRLQLDFSTPTEKVATCHLDYSEAHSDPRVGIMKLAVESAGMQGRLDTFFRPTPVAQPSYAEICEQVDSGEFADRRALVIGGSRGAGETTAKVLAAGGAQVIVTYNRGEAEARKIQQEIQAASGRCEIMMFDVHQPDGQDTTPFADQLPPSHVYYFASPHIQANRSKQWDPDLHQTFCRFYLQAFSAVTNLYSAAAAEARLPIHFFYPSSIYVEEPEKGFAEYTVTKAAGEALCVQLADRYPNSRFSAPRLPRMATDQTSSIIPIKSASTLSVMYEALRQE